MISFADKRVHELKEEVDGRLVCHNLHLPSFTVHSKSDVRVSCLHGFVAATGEAFGDERLGRSPGAAVVLVPTVAGDNEGDWNSVVSHLVCLREQREQRHMIVSNIQGFVNRRGLQASRVQFA